MLLIFLYSSIQIKSQAHMKLDILAIAAHPDDVELACSGILMKHIDDGKKVGVIDLTMGELGTRGTPELRFQEAAAASEIMGIHARDNLRMADGFFMNDAAHQLQVIKAIRTYQPEILITNALKDRHPDHGRAAQLVIDSSFKAGLRKIQTIDHKGTLQAAHRPKVIYHFIQDTYIEPDIVVDVSAYIERKKAAILAYSSQFYNPDSNTKSKKKGVDKEPQTFISQKGFFERLFSRLEMWGRHAGFAYAEGLTVNRSVGVKSLFDLS